MTDDLSPLESAFHALRSDAARLDTAAARVSLQGRRGISVPALVVAGVVVVLAAVGVSQLTSDPPSEMSTGPALANPGDEALSVIDTSWTLETAQILGGEFASFDGGHTLTFNADTIDGRATCNTFGAGYTRNGTSISVGAIRRTDAACGELGPQFLTSLEAVDTIEISGDTLVLTGPEIELRFVRNTGAPIDELIGRTWLLQQVLDAADRRSPLGDASLLLLADGTIGGSTGCRTLSGTYVVAGNEIRMTEFGTAGECPAEWQRQDDIIISVLADGFVAEVDERELIIAAGSSALVYREAAGGVIPDPPVASNAERLLGTAWTFVSGTGADGELAIGPNSPPGFAVSETSRFTTSDGCNGFSADLVLDGPSWELGLLISTLVGCEETAEPATFALSDLTNTSQFAFQGDETLILTGPGTELIFERAETGVDDPTSFVDFLTGYLTEKGIDYDGPCPDAQTVTEMSVCSGEIRPIEPPDIYATFVGLSRDYTGDQSAPFATDFGVADIVARRVAVDEWELVELITVGLPDDE